MAGVLYNLMHEVIIYTIFSVLFLCAGTLYHYEICFDDSVRLTLQYKTVKLFHPFSPWLLYSLFTGSDS